MASSTVAALLLLFTLQSSAYLSVKAGGLDYGFECSPGDAASNITKTDLQKLLQQDLKTKTSDSDSTHGERRSKSGIWSWLAHLNAAGVSDEGTTSKNAALARRRGGMHPKGKGMHPKGVGMHPKGKGMHGKKRRPVPTPSAGGFRADIIVAADGSGNYKKVQDGINAARKGQPGKRFILYVKAGNYREKCVVPESKQYLTIVGDKGRTRIYYDDAAATIGGDSKTARSASFSIFADGFTAVDITFENTYGWPNGREGSQAVAVLVDSDQSQFFGVTFKGYQDTLFSYAGKQYYYKCHIIGQVDFIFGNARALYQDCLIEVVNNADNRYTAVAAQNRPSRDYNSGFVFLGGRVIGTGASFPEYGTYLGRTWGPYCTIVYINVAIDVAVRPEGWNDMHNPEYTDTAIMLAYGNSGRGANGRSWEIGKVVGASAVSQYNGLHFIEGSRWIARPSFWN